jgi:hypothetical protein
MPALLRVARSGFCIYLRTAKVIWQHEAISDSIRDLVLMPGLVRVLYRTTCKSFKTGHDPSSDADVLQGDARLVFH